MKILVFAQRLDVGGTQVNAIELTAALRDLWGHDVALFAAPGPMSELVRQKRLRFLPAPDALFHPSPARMRALRDVARRERPDLIHVWDWPQCLDAYYAAHLFDRIPMVTTVMSMVVPRLLPKALPTTFGTPELVDKAKTAGRTPVELILPPVDVHLNAPGAVDATSFREQSGIKDGDVTLVTVSRLVAWLKGESLRRTIRVVRALGHEFPLRLVIVGDGPARAELHALAQEANKELGRAAVVLVGPMIDPRPAYEAADIIVGMGGSALRGMAFGKPVVVVGEANFSAPFNPKTADSFYYNGIYGLGSNEPGDGRLLADIRGVVERPEQFAALGEYAREFVLQHFNLETVSGRLARFFEHAVARPPRLSTAAVDGLRTAIVYLAGTIGAGDARRRLSAIRFRRRLPVRGTAQRPRNHLRQP